MREGWVVLVFCGSLLAACNQPFEPDGPPDSRLVLYALLNATSDTQYVRVATTFGGSSGPAVRDAAVLLQWNGRAAAFHDTTVQWRDSSGNAVATPVYVAYNLPLQGGAQYTLQVTTPGGLSASAVVSAIAPPLFSLQPFAKPGFFVLDTQYRSVTGAAALHFYMDYYVLLNGGWVLRTEELPVGMRLDAAGTLISEYMGLTPVPVLASAGTRTEIDSALFQYARSRVMARYIPAPVVYLDIRFTVTQIDQALYDYYYITNGPVDQSTIRLDVPDYTNVRGGYGVCGSRAEVGLIFSLVQ